MNQGGWITIPSLGSPYVCNASKADCQARQPHATWLFHSCWYADLLPTSSNFSTRPTNLSRTKNQQRARKIKIDLHHRPPYVRWRSDKIRNKTAKEVKYCCYNKSLQSQTARLPAQLLSCEGDLSQNGYGTNRCKSVK